MRAGRYDVIVVGARVAGASTAMLLARQGLRVLAVDRASFPSDTIHRWHRRVCCAVPARQCPNPGGDYPGDNCQRPRATHSD